MIYLLSQEKIMKKIIFQTNDIKNNIGYLNAKLQWWDIYNIVGDERDNFKTITIEKYYDTVDFSLLRSGGFLRMFSSKNITRNSDKKFFVEFKKDSESKPIKLPVDKFDEIVRYTKFLGIKDPIHFIFETNSENHFFPVQFDQDPSSIATSCAHLNFVVEDVKIYSSDLQCEDRQIRFISLRDVTEKKTFQKPTEAQKRKSEEAFHIFTMLMNDEGYSEIDKTRYQLLMDITQQNHTPNTNEKENKNERK